MFVWLPLVNFVIVDTCYKTGMFITIMHWQPTSCVYCCSETCLYFNVSVYYAIVSLFLTSFSICLEVSFFVFCIGNFIENALYVNHWRSSVKRMTLEVSKCENFIGKINAINFEFKTVPNTQRSGKLNTTSIGLRFEYFLIYNSFIKNDYFSTWCLTITMWDILYQEKVISECRSIV